MISQAVHRITPHYFFTVFDFIGTKSCAENLLIPSALTVILEEGLTNFRSNDKYLCLYDL